jgi:hypothetical protein
MAAIFKHGASTKGQMLDVIVNEMILAGWTNLSSYKEMDGYVMHSNGTLGNNDLLIQLIPYPLLSYTQSVANYNTYKLTTSSAHNLFTVRFPMSYVPGDAGVGGTLGRTSSHAPVAILNYPTAMAPSLYVEYDIYADKNKVIVVIKPLDSVSTSSQVIYIGAPETQFVASLGNRGLILASSAFYTNYTNNVVIAADYPDAKLGTSGANYNMCAVQCSVPIDRFPNVNDIFFMEELYYYSPMTGMIGKIDGLYMLGNTTNYKAGDIIKVGTSKFKMVYCYNGGPNPYGTHTTFASYTWIAIQVA